ncbi:hypothetical protein [Agromyces albus]|uniref:hypothetical protein n=1 Tax=Agromyces albus TaxID=205332 RepID=UPI0027808B50|nr:hypothetical protein [Agromyces albus]MDQ0574300.1 hypothetical protein [Agromyces albus]
MSRSRTARITALALFALLGYGLSGCAADAPTAAPVSAAASNEAEAEPQPEPADLVGEWVQTNSESEDSYQVATITADSIEVNWISESNDTRALYWAGSYTAPTSPGTFEWVSQNDTEKTAGAMLASSDATKTFAYDEDVIRYDVTAMGVTKTVELERK